MYSEFIKDTVKVFEATKLKEKDKKKLHEQYIKSFKKFKSLDFSKMKFDIKNYKSFENLK